MSLFHAVMTKLWCLTFSDHIVVFPHTGNNTSL